MAAIQSKGVAQATPLARIAYRLNGKDGRRAGATTPAEALFRPPDGYNDFITTPMSFVGVFTPEQCASIVALGERGDFDYGRLVYPQEDYRSTSVSWMAFDKETRWIYEKLAELFHQVNRWYRFELSGIDVLQFSKYQKGDKIGWHPDTGPGSTSTRKISLTVQLSDQEDYRGGGLEFCPLGELEMSRPLGTVIVFPSFCPHRVTAVTRGCRHSLVAWANGPVFR
jgi:PKHD-type hydroxylase